MAQQESLIKLKGTIGDLTFYKTADGYMARRKGGITAERLKNDPAFARTRENMAEFARAGKAVKLMRTALRSQLKQGADKRVTSRLMQEFRKVIQADAVSTRGQRNVIDGEISLLHGFEFNENGKLGQSFIAPYTPVIDRAAGTLAVNIPEFNPSEMILIPQGATHCKLVTVGLQINFESNQYTVGNSESDPIALSSTTQAALALSQAVAAANTDPLLLLFGVRFFQQVNTQLYPLQNGAYNALALVGIDGGA